MTPSTSPASNSRENVVRAIPGAVMLAVNLGLTILGIVLLVMGVQALPESQNDFHPFMILGPLLNVVGVFLFFGHFTLQPNEARVLILFGRYRGTVRDSGFHWANPFYTRIRSRTQCGPGDSGSGQHSANRGISYRVLTAKISLRARNFISEKLKVND